MKQLIILTLTAVFALNGLSTPLPKVEAPGIVEILIEEAELRVVEVSPDKDIVVQNLCGQEAKVVIESDTGVEEIFFLSEDEEFSYTVDPSVAWRIITHEGT